MNKIKSLIYSIKKPIICLIICLFLLIILYSNIVLLVVADNSESKYDSNEQSTIYDQNSSHIYRDNSVLVHMLDLKNNGNGDSIIIKYGNTEILMDAGGGTNSGNVIYDALKYYCTDNVVEFVILTHGDSDHIVNFCKENTGFRKWLKEKGNSCDLLIDFDILYDKTITTKTYKCLNTLYKKGDSDNSFEINYESFRDFKNAQLMNHKIKNYLTASQITYYLTNRKFFDSENEVDIDLTPQILADNSKSSISNDEIKILENVKKNDGFILSKDPNSINVTGDVKLKILYNYFYDHSYKTEGLYQAKAVDKNLLSICSMLSIGSTPKNGQKDTRQKFLFTGDLEEYDSAQSYLRVYGETKLIENNIEDFKSPFIFYKASHHGSSTSNSIFLMDVIRPQYVGISCSFLGEHSFPKDNAIANITKYTDYVYITGYFDGSNTLPYYGNVSFHFDISTNKMDVNYDTSEPKSIFSSERFIKDRSFIAQIYNLTDIYGDNNSTNNNYDVECTYIKIGHMDILINFGNNTDKICKNTNILKNLNGLCNDGILEYMIITSTKLEYYNHIFSNRKIKNGLLDNNDLDIKEVSNVFVSKYFYKKNANTECEYEKFLKTLYSKKSNLVKNIFEIDSIYSVDIFNSNDYKYLEGNKYVSCNLNFLKHRYLSSQANDAYHNGIPFVMSLETDISNVEKTIFSYMNLGSIYENNELEYIADNNESFAKKVTLLQIPANGYCGDKNTSENEGLFNLIKVFKNPNNFNCLLNSTLNKKNTNGENIVLNYKEKINTYLTNKLTDGWCESLAGNVYVRIYVGALSNAGNIRTRFLSSHFSFYDVNKFLDYSSEVYYIFTFNDENELSYTKITKMGQLNGATYDVYNKELLTLNKD